MHALGYVRVSKAREDMISPDIQRDEIMRYAVRHDLEVTEWFEDLDISGRTDERPALQAMLQRATDDDVDAVIVYRLDRFSREPLHFYQLVHSLRQAGVEQLHDAVMLFPFDLKPTVRCDSIMAEGVNVADDLPDEIQRWIAKRRAALILASLREGETSAHGRCSGLARGQTRSRWGEKQYDSPMLMGGQGLEACESSGSKRNRRLVPLYRRRRAPDTVKAEQASEGRVARRYRPRR